MDDVLDFIAFEESYHSGGGSGGSGGSGNGCLIGIIIFFIIACLGSC